MAKITLTFAAALILLGAVCFAASGAEHPTALIPVWFGIPLALGGALALKPKLRMHAMHLSVLVGLIGFIGAVISMIMRKPSGLALVDMLGMALLSGIFVVLCVRSFIQARRARVSASLS